MLTNMEVFWEMTPWLLFRWQLGRSPISTIMKRKWLFVNGCECKSEISKAMAILNSCLDVTNESNVLRELYWGGGRDNFSGINELNRTA